MSERQTDGSALRHVSNIYYRGPHYDRRYATYTHDIDFWRDLAHDTGGPVLELAAGTGRLSLPLARLGLDVVGLDVAPSMIEQALAKRGPTGPPAFRVADMRSFDLGRRFALVMLACSSVCHLLDDADAVSCFTSVAAHLAPHGVFALDVATPAHEAARADGVLKDRFRYPDPATGADIAVRGRRRYDPATRILTDDMDYTFTADGRTEHAHRTSRMYTTDDLRPLLARAGLRLARAYGDFDRTPPTEDSATQILLCAHDAPSPRS
ncbi:class I SAM-dependent methyltransferase [Streptomyces sp. NPDC005840]|uniref:class I SAM-dependent methyltransferase n=1 Tax=Streptomyces sp. NPDC005840 TaxID=3157072 RepID=UPI0033CB021B